MGRLLLILVGLLIASTNLAAAAGIPRADAPPSVSVAAQPRRVMLLISNCPSKVTPAVAAVGDVNGDGFPDLAVGVPLPTPRQIVSGRCIIYGGSPTGMVLQPLNIISPTGHWSFGYAVVGVGDVNGDRLADFVVSVPYHGVTAADAGKLILYLGSRDGTPKPSGWFVRGPSKDSRLGRRLCAPGDLNGDGYSDLIADSYGGRASMAISLLIYRGQPGGFETNIMSAIRLEYWRDSSHRIVALGDVNGDRCADILTSYADARQPDENNWKTMIFSGAPTGLVHQPAWSWSGEHFATKRGEALGVAGDVDGDGTMDWLVGEAGAVGHYAYAGMVHLFLGTNSASGWKPKSHWTESPGQPYSHFGAAVTGVGDVNGDGLADFVVGAPDDDDDLPDQGRVYLWLGAKGAWQHRHPVNRPPNWLQAGPVAHGHFGAEVVALGDVDRDGLADFAVTTPGYSTNEARMDIFYGSRTAYTNLSRQVQLPATYILTNSAGAEARVAAAFAQREAARQAGIKARELADATDRATKQRAAERKREEDELQKKVATAEAVLKRPPLVQEIKVLVWSRWPYGVAAIGLLVAIGIGARYVHQRRQAAAQVEAAAARERERIARDVHDELGGEITRLTLLGSDPAMARQLGNAMRSIVWRETPANDSLENLVQFLGRQAEQTFADLPMRLRFDLPVEVPVVPLTSQYRGQLLLAVREALTNILRHAQANEVCLRMRIEPSELAIELEDDGVGLPPPDQIRRGNGLNNIEARVRTVGGQVRWEPRPGGGTRVIITAPLPR